ncbi:hypothetical protein V8C86DRAFT_2672330, partial [Haematococcus lacustris]
MMWWCRAALVAPLSQFMMRLCACFTPSTRLCTSGYAWFMVLTSCSTATLSWSRHSRCSTQPKPMGKLLPPLTRTAW